MKDGFLDSMESHFKAPGVRHRLTTCSEFSIVEQWFRMEIYMWLRKMEWRVPLVEGPYYTRLPVRPSKKKLWNERAKWCDLVAMVPGGVRRLELKAIWYRPRTWKQNLYSALDDLLSLAAMDVEKTKQLWKKPTGDAFSYRAFLQPFGEEWHFERHHRYSLCLLQGFPDEFFERGLDDSLTMLSSRYLHRRTEKVRTGSPKEYGWAGEEDRRPALEACDWALTSIPEEIPIGILDRGSGFLEADPKGVLEIVVWKVQ